ncbi:alpha-L-rhamnosidase C-terminal domain-containing protein [Sphingobium sp.]|uniref:alpha-L-rhamnosidase C-terminal domain-containing protein n=1 Tax=Sphingobium sp. TaxID=1912891 RepID=UPI0039C9F793
MGNNGINHLKASVRTINGIITSEWSKTGGKLTMKVTVPVNTLAHIWGWTRTGWRRWSICLTGLTLRRASCRICNCCCRATRCR